MDPVAVIVLAAGLGKRIGGDQPKVLLEVSGRPLINWVTQAAFALAPSRIVIVTGYGREQVENVVTAEGKRLGWDGSRIAFAHQDRQLGTGHAARCASEKLGDFKGTVLILYGDVPLIRNETLMKLLRQHYAEKATISLISLLSREPAAYGRIIRERQGKVTRIAEAKDCSKNELLINELNVGIYAVDSAFLNPALQGLSTNNAQQEYYLTDIVSRAAREGQVVSCLQIEDASEVQGINTRLDLAEVRQTARERKILSLLQSGVDILDTRSLLIDDTASISPGVVIGPNVTILGSTSIGSGTIIEGNAYLKDVLIGESCQIKFSVRAEQAAMKCGVSVGPFANLRPGTVLDDNSRIGNFVETKNAHLGCDAKANHLTYLGDCAVGDKTNIGAGTITCNYDGYRKHRTTIGKDVFIGSNTSLVAPVEIEDGATVGAGSVITKRVEKDSLAFTRPPQTAKAGWSKKRRDLMGRH